MNEPHISGAIHFDPPPTSLAGATVRVRLEDVSLAGAPSRVLAEQVLTDLSVGEARAGLSFRLEAPAGDPGVAYALSVHADLDGDGAISHGDYINYESYPVPSDRPAGAMVVRVRPVHGRRAPPGPGPT